METFVDGISVEGKEEHVFCSDVERKDEDT